MENSLTIRDNPNEITSIIQNSNNMHLAVLNALGLPTQDILSSVDERKIAISNLPYIIEKMNTSNLSDAYYLSKFFVAVSTGLFDAALNYLWDETIKQLRIRILNGDIKYFYDVVISDDKRKNFTSPEDLLKLDDYDLIKGALQIDLITPIGYKHLDYIRYMRNWASAAHPNQADLTGLNLVSWLEICIKEVIATPLSNVLIQTNRLLYNIKNEAVDSSQAETISLFFTELSHDKADALAKGLLGECKDLTSTPFEASKGTLRKIVKTNLYPVSFPSTCYQFKVNYATDEKSWDFCKNLSKYNIMAVPYKDLVYAWGEKGKIAEVCLKRLVGNIEVTPFTRELVLQNKTFRELLLKTITRILAERNGFSFSKDKIWDSKDTKNAIFYRISNRPIHAYMGVRLSLEFDYKYTYLSFVPAYHFRDSDKYTRDVIKSFADLFSTRVNGSKPNLSINNYIDQWTSVLIGTTAAKVDFPAKQEDKFSFAFGPNSALIGINSNSASYSIQLPTSIDRRRLIMNGIECRDPELAFFNSQQNKMVNDFHPMRGLTQNCPFDFALNDKVLRSSINIGVLCPQNHSSKFYEFLNELNCRHSVNFNVDYVLPFPGFYDAFNVGLNIPLTTAPQWLNMNTTNNTDIKIAAKEFGRSIISELEKLSSQQTDVVLIYIPKEFEWLTSFSDDFENFDLHNFVKAYAAQKSIATQFVREKTIESELRCQIMWALSLAIYVKSCRIPWVISGLRNDTAFAGIGYSINKSTAGTDVVVGCSHIYSADGQGLKYKLSKLNDFVLDRKKNPFLSENEAYKLGLNIKELFYKSFTELPKRVVIHKRTPFKKEEIDGLVKCLSSAGITDIELLEINYEDDIRCFEFSKDFCIDGFPVRRGLCFPLSADVMLLYTHGIAPSIRNPNFKYIQGGKTIPLPLKIVKHYGAGDMAQIASEILGLSKMNWNSFGLYSKLPCTIESSNEIARIGWLLSQYEGSIYDYRFFM